MTYEVASNRDFTFLSHVSTEKYTWRSRKLETITSVCTSIFGTISVEAIVTEIALVAMLTISNALHLPTPRVWDFPLPSFA